MAEDISTQKKDKFKQFFYRSGISYLILAFLMVLGYVIRTKNLKLLVDTTTGKYIPLALDPFVFLRYAKEILLNGSLASVDVLRYYPFGHTQIGEFSVLSHFIVWLYKFLHFFNPQMTLEYAHVLYPPIMFSLSLFFFFLLLRRLFNDKVALLATAFLVVLPSYLYRTMAGFSDKESLAMFFFFAVLYFYVRAWQEERLRHALFFALLAGITTGLMGLTWGGVGLVFLTIGLFALAEVVLDKFTKKDFYVYTVWLFSLLIILKTFISPRYTLNILVTSATSGFMLLAFVVGLVTFLIKRYNFFSLQEKLKNKMPLGVFSLFVSVVFGALFVTLFAGFSSIFNTARTFLIDILEPFGVSRWHLTVAESHQPYVADWIAQMGWIYILFFIIGSIFLFYSLVKHMRIKYKATVFYSFFIFAFIFSRYRAGTILDGVSALSKILYLGSLLAFSLGIALFYYYAYRKDKDLYKAFLQTPNSLIFVFTWFLVSVVAARGAVRLIHIFSPITAVLAAYAFYVVYDYAKHLEKKHYKFLLYGVLLLLLFLPNIQGTLLHSYQSSSSRAQFTGPSYTQQWQHAMTWVRENTSEDAVFAHWWDYGYWVQTGGERATLTDGGNAGGYAVNYFMGRHVLTGQNETEALEFLYARNATHLLMISDEIGKYPAYSSIGSDVTYDRRSYIPSFSLDNSQTQERRDDTLLVYRGAFGLDEDFTFENNLFPAGSSGIGGFILPIVTGENGSFVMKQPEAVLVYNGQQFNIPVECVFFNGKEIGFAEDGLEGCLYIFPRASGQQIESLGTAFYLSPRVRKTLLTHLFLYGEESEHFELVYNDASLLPLPIGYINGRFIGPLKIWKIHYPEGITSSPYYYGKELPDPDVIKV